MTVIRTTKDTERLTLTIVAEFSAPAERVFRLWEDARQLERWWGPPGWPATFTRHDFVVGGESRYYMRGPDGEVHHGFWQLRAIEKPRRIDFTNGLAGADGEPMQDVPPMTGSVTFEQNASGTLMTVVTRFLDLAQMETMLGMGMAEGMAQAVGQIDRLLDSALL